jgi:hypothetical protein
LAGFDVSHQSAEFRPPGLGVDAPVILPPPFALDAFGIGVDSNFPLKSVSFYDGPAELDLLLNRLGSALRLVALAGIYGYRPCIGGRSSG